MKTPTTPSNDWYEKHGVQPPEHIDHDQELKPLKLRNFRQEGNRLIADTDMGEWMNFIPTNKLLIGEKDGLPIFRDV